MINQLRNSNIESEQRMYKMLKNRMQDKAEIYEGNQYYALQK